MSFETLSDCRLVCDGCNELFIYNGNDWFVGQIEAIDAAIKNGWEVEVYPTMRHLCPTCPRSEDERF